MFSPTFYRFVKLRETSNRTVLSLVQLRRKKFNAGNPDYNLVLISSEIPEGKGSVKQKKSTLIKLMKMLKIAKFEPEHNYVENKSVIRHSLLLIWYDIIDISKQEKMSISYGFNYRIN